jgi:hypothetical protein
MTKGRYNLLLFILLAEAEFLSARCSYTEKKENEIFLTYKEIQMGSVAKPYIRKDFLIQFMRKCANI